MITSREIPLVPSQSALLIVDMQNYCAHEDGEGFKNAGDIEGGKYSYLLTSLPPVVSNIQRLQQAFRHNSIEVIFCVIESQTDDGRDRGLDYKLTGFHVPRGSWDAKVIDDLAPVGDEIVISKTSSSVFNSTNIDYVLRALGVTQLVIVGMATDQCVESAIRDACDLGYLVTLVPDACVTYSRKRQLASENAIRGYCRSIKASELIAEVQAKSRESEDC